MENEATNIKVELNVLVTDENIDDIMASVLYDGVWYWCSRCEVVGEMLGEYVSEQISRGGELEFYLDEVFDEAGTEMYRLNKDSFLKGLKMYLEESHVDCYDLSARYDCAVIDTCVIDAPAADMIVQYAMFGELVYG